MLVGENTEVDGLGKFLFFGKKKAAPAPPPPPPPAAPAPGSPEEAAAKAGAAPKFAASTTVLGIPKNIAPYVIIGGSVVLLSVVAFIALRD